jgi:hypothetical protein
MPFDYIAPYFQHYRKPYDTTYESHSKTSKASTKYQLYCKTTKDNIEIDITRLELKKDYSKKRSPILIEDIKQLKEIEEELLAMTKAEFEKYCPNVPHSHHTDSAEPYTLYEVEAINLINREILSLNIVEHHLEIHTENGIIIYNYGDSTLTFPKALLPTALRLQEKPPPLHKLQEIP